MSQQSRLKDVPFTELVRTNANLADAVAAARKALALKEDDPYVLNDLGWSLVLAGSFEEARAVLERAVALARADYSLPRNNLRELEKRSRSKRSK
jgi:Flp pilus assembly protein TadD